jgi:hypothetical protein
MPPRSPVIFWLLLAATLSVDAATAGWVFWGQLREESATPFLALSFAQLGILCVWAVFIPKRIRLSWVAPLFLGIAVAVLVALSAPSSPLGQRWEMFLAFIVLTWTHAAIVLPILWLLKPTRFGTAFVASDSKPRWQFSTMHLLTVMTCLAVLSMVLRQSSEWAREAMVVLVTLPVANISLLILVIVAVQMKRHWLLRLAISLGGALVIAVVSESSGAEFADGMNFYVYCVIQAIVLWMWLELFRSQRLIDTIAEVQSQT